MHHLLTIVFLCAAIVTAEIDLSIFPYSYELSDNERYTVYWDFNETHIELAVKAKGLGWVGMGFSNSGGMLEADAVIGTVYDNGTVVLDDYYIDGRTALCTQSGGVCPDTSSRINGKNNIIAYDGEISNGYTILTWLRLLNTSDTHGDVVLTPSNPSRTITWAYHPTSKTLVYHNPDTHGYQLVQLFPPTPTDGTTTEQAVSVGQYLAPLRALITFVFVYIFVM